MEEQARKMKEKRTHQENKIDEQYNFTDDRRRLQQQHYHNVAKIYQF